LTNYAGSSDQPPQPPRPVIKMPKAVASVTSVPTRADYQQQLEANLERKRKREKGETKNDLGGPQPEVGGKGKRKRGRGAKTVDEDSEYRPKTKESSESSSNKNDSVSAEKMRKTRGKPPKKCLAETDEHEPGDLKAESMKYAEAIRAQFDEPKGAQKGRKKKRKAAAATEAENASSKTPRLVIKFSKESVNNLKENGGDEYDFVEDNHTPAPPVANANAPNVDGTVDSALSSVNNSPNSAATEVSKVTKLKIKI